MTVFENILGGWQSTGGGFEILTEELNVGNMNISAEGMRRSTPDERWLFP